MAAYIIPILLFVALPLGGVVAFMFYKLLRSTPGGHAAEERPSDESRAALKDRSPQL